MPDAEPAMAQIAGVAPSLLVADIASAAAYYADTLGFTVPRLWGCPPSFCIACRDGLRVMLSQVADPALVRPNGALADQFDVYFWVRDADALFAEFQANGADVVFGPVDRPLYGLREFAARDPDGHVLVFAHPIA